MQPSRTRDKYSDGKYRVATRMQLLVNGRQLTIREEFFRVGVHQIAERVPVHKFRIPLVCFHSETAPCSVEQPARARDQ